MTAVGFRIFAASWFHLARRALWLAVVCQFSSKALAATELTFCYQDTELLPFYRGAGQQVPVERPGATLEHLQQIVAKVPGLRLQLLRFPWQRCLKYLQSGEVDAVVANYSDERRTIAVFPLRHNQPDPNREFTKQEICLVIRKELAPKWNGSSFDGMAKVVVAQQAGRNLEQLFSHRQFVKIPISAQAKALQMLALNKVQAVTMVCKIAGTSTLANGFDPDIMQMQEPAIETLHGHLIFSKQFYQAQPQVAEALWAQLAEPPIEIYLQYLNDNTSDAP
jgi:polar amino acid transport system substrate-binding protein